MKKLVKGSGQFCHGWSCFWALGHTTCVKGNNYLMIYKPVMVLQEERVGTQLISLGESEKQQFMMAESS